MYYFGHFFIKHRRYTRIFNVFPQLIVTHTTRYILVIHHSHAYRCIIDNENGNEIQFFFTTLLNFNRREQFVHIMVPCLLEFFLKIGYLNYEVC